VSYVTIHAMQFRAQLRRGATLAQESHEGVRVPNCIRPRTHSRNAHALPGESTVRYDYRLTSPIIAAIWTTDPGFASIPFLRPPLRDSHWLEVRTLVSKRTH